MDFKEEKKIEATLAEALIKVGDADHLGGVESTKAPKNL